MIFDTGSVRLHYETQGQGAPLILLHGNGENLGIFDKAIPLLAEHFAVYAIDSRGHGGSSPVPEYHYADMAEDVAAFIAGMGLKKPVIYGFSDGGILALLLAIRHPDRVGGIVASGVNTRPDGVKAHWRWLFRFIHAMKRDPLLHLMLTEPDISEEELRSIACPALITAGSKDMLKQSHMRRIADLIPGGRYLLIEGEDHGSYIVHSEKIASVIIDACQGWNLLS